MANLLQTVFGNRLPAVKSVITLLDKETDPTRVKDFAKTVEAAKMRDRDSAEKRDYWGEISVWASRRLALLIKQGQEDGTIRKAGGNQALLQAGVMNADDLMPSASRSRANKLAKLDEEEIRLAIDELKEQGAEISRPAIVAKANGKRNLVKSKPKRIRKELHGIHHCSFTDLELADDSVDLIFTDPPYDRKSVSLYNDMLKMAARVLVPGGSCLCYCGHLFVPEIVQFAKDAGLRFYWLCAVLHRKKAAIPRNGIHAGWKPIIWFTKGERYDTSKFVHDCVLDEIEKGDHEWQQPVSQAERYIEALSRKNHVVFDPFCGSGTTAVAAKKLNRKWITCDVDDNAVQVARERIDNA